MDAEHAIKTGTTRLVKEDWEKENDRTSLLVYITHLRDLVASLPLVALVNANCIYPEDSISEWTTKVYESLV